MIDVHPVPVCVVSFLILNWCQLPHYPDALVTDDHTDAERRLILL